MKKKKKISFYCIKMLILSVILLSVDHEIYYYEFIYLIIPDRLSPFLPIIHRLRQVFRVTSRVLT